MRYPNSQEPWNLLENLAFRVPSGSIVSLLGRSGVGKTTLLRIIAGLERGFRGEVILNGRKITRPSRSIQLVFQDYRLLPWKTVVDNIAFATQRKGNGADRAQVEKWLRIVGLVERRNALPKTLSGGEAGRVAFARAFIDQPEVLLLDEPFRSLDLMTKMDLQAELMQVLDVQPTAVVLVSHSIEDAVYMSDTVHILSDRPMHIEKTFTVGVPRPREQGDQQLGEIAAEIAGYLAAGRTQ